MKHVQFKENTIKNLEYLDGNVDIGVNLIELSQLKKLLYIELDYEEKDIITKIKHPHNIQFGYNDYRETSIRVINSIEDYDIQEGSYLQVYDRNTEFEVELKTKNHDYYLYIRIKS